MNAPTTIAVASTLGVGAAFVAWKGAWNGLHRAEANDMQDPSTARDGTYGQVRFMQRMLFTSGGLLAGGLAAGVGGAALLRTGTARPAAALAGATLVGIGVVAISAGALGALNVAATRHIEFAP